MDMAAFGNFDEGGDGFMVAQSSEQPAQMMPQSDASQFAALAATPAPMDDAPIQMMAQASSAAAAPKKDDDDLTEEEQLIVAAAKEKQEQLKKDLHERMVDEQKQKDERRIAGSSAIMQWQKEREGQIQLRKENNANMEAQFQTSKDEARQRNPWEVVCENCDLSVQGVNAGGKDKSRMKQAMINRKGDNIKPEQQSAFGGGF